MTSFEKSDPSAGRRYRARFLLFVVVHLLCYPIWFWVRALLGETPPMPLTAALVAIQGLILFLGIRCPLCRSRTGVGFKGCKACSTAFR